MGGRGVLLFMWTAIVAVIVPSPAAAAAAGAGNFSDEVAALMAVRAALQDPGDVLRGWDAAKSGDNPCRWSMVYCHHGQLRELNLKQKNLSGTLSPEIGRLTSLRFLYLSQNAIYGHIPDTIGNMQLLQRLDLSNNQFNGSIPDALGELPKLQYLELNNNSLSGQIPTSLCTARKIVRLDLSFNNLSGRRPIFRASIVILGGNPLLSGVICGKGETGEGNPLSGFNCSYVTAEQDHSPLILPPTKNTANSHGTEEENKYIPYIVVLCIATVCMVAAFITGATLFLRRGRQPQQVFAVVEGQNSPEGYLGHLKQYKLEDMKKATNNFSQENILGEGAFGIVYKGCLPDGSIVAVKRLKGHVSALGDDQFHTEVEVVSLVAHHNLLHLIGFCTTDDERILVYPYMPNGTVASKLQEQVDGKPALDWPRRKMIALGAARGLCYLHEQCDPKIIHRDIKASNILLDEYLEAVVADFGLAKLVDHGVSHIVTIARGTIGRIPPEAVRIGYSSEKTDIFGFGLLLIEIITGRKTMEVHEDEVEEGGIAVLAKELLKQNQLSTFVDKRLGSDYDSAELEEIVQIAMLCTMYNPDHRPRMSEVVRMLEGGYGVAEKWEALKDVDQDMSPPPEFMLHAICYGSHDFSSIEMQASELSGPR